MTWFHNSKVLYISQSWCKLDQEQWIVANIQKCSQETRIRDLNFLPFEFMGSFFMLTGYDPVCGVFYWSQNNTATGGSQAAGSSNPNQSLNTVVSNNAGFSKKLNMILSNYHCLGGEKTQFLSWAILCNVTPVVTQLREGMPKK